MRRVLGYPAKVAFFMCAGGFSEVLLALNDKELVGVVAQTLQTRSSRVEGTYDEPTAGCLTEHLDNPKLYKFREANTVKLT